MSFIDLKDRIQHVYPDNMFLSLFLPRSLSALIDDDGQHRLTCLVPFSVGEYIVATDRFNVAWVKQHDSSSLLWSISLLDRQSDELTAIRKLVGLMIQASFGKPLGEWIHPVQLPNYGGETVTIGRSKYPMAQIELLQELHSCKCAQFRMLFDQQHTDALFFRWGEAGGGCVMPLVDN